MRRIYLLLLLLSISQISAIEINLSKEVYNPQETLQAEITGNFLSITAEDILVYKEDSVHSTPAISDLTKQGDIYYFYAILPNNEGNFSLRIEGVQYLESGKIKADAISKNFSINKTGASSLSINPGFVVASNNFSIKIKSLNKNQGISAVLESTKEAKTFSLVEEAEKIIEFSVSSEKTEFTNLKINNYNIPVFVIGKTPSVVNGSNASKFNKSDEIAPKINITNKTADEISAMDCIDIGEICGKNEKCAGETVSSLDGPCCAGECIEKKPSGYFWVIGVAIILLTLMAVIFFYFKGKKMQKPKSTEEILRNKAMNFEDRMKGSRVSRGISRD